jgi:hypothetical protein
MGDGIRNQSSTDSQTLDRGWFRAVNVHFENAASHALVSCSCDRRERLAVPLSLHKSARRTGRTGANLNRPRRGTYDVVRSSRTSAIARRLQTRPGLRRRADLRTVIAMRSQIVSAERGSARSRMHVTAGRNVALNLACQLGGGVGAGRALQRIWPGRRRPRTVFHERPFWAHPTPAAYARCPALTARSLGRS